MQCRIADLRYKEIINVTTGQRLGYVSDALIDIVDGRILSIIVPGPARFFGLFGHEDDYIIPWESLSRIGDDIILIDDTGPLQRGRREKRSFF